MKKYSRLIAIVVLVLLFVLLYPNKQTKEVVTEAQIEEMTAYVVQVAKLNKVQESIVKQYDQHVLKESNQIKAYDYLADTILPLYETYVQEVGKIKATDTNIQKVHNVYLKATKERLNVYEKLVEAYQSQTEVLYVEANKQVPIVNDLFKHHDAELRTLAKRYDISMPKEK